MNNEKTMTACNIKAATRRISMMTGKPTRSQKIGPGWWTVDSGNDQWSVDIDECKCECIDCQV